MNHICFAPPLPDNHYHIVTCLVTRSLPVAIGLINHNVTYLLSSEIPALRNGQYRPMPFRASTPPAPDNVAHQSSGGDSNSLQPNSTARSRSNSQATSISAAGQRMSIDIKEEQDTCSRNDD